MIELTDEAAAKIDRCHAASTAVINVLLDACIKHHVPDDAIPDDLITEYFTAMAEADLMTPSAWANALGTE